ncbi:hypothetical protein FS749_016778 [Ceratobasidium sp. UAMH 11750]|nr:hypothetical protein FS749_016778 [Ceratobasidium sp. UAMH 11750]
MESACDPDHTTQAWGGGISCPASVASYVSNVSHHSYAIPDPDAQSGLMMGEPYDPSQNVSPADICAFICACHTKTNGQLDKIEKEIAATNSWLRRLNHEVATKDEISTVKTQVDSLGAYTQAIYKDTQSLIGAVGKIESTLQSPPPTTSPQQTSTIPKRMSTIKSISPTTISVKTAKPDKFDGSKKDKATEFCVACTQHLRSTYPNASEDQQVMFVTSYLEGIVHDWLRPHLELDLSTPMTWLHDIDLFWAEFNKHFGEVNKKETYWGKLCTLSQTKSVQDYLRDFQTFSGPLQYDDTVLCDIFYNSLKDKIKSATVAQLFDYDVSTTTFAHVANQALKVNQRLEAFMPRNQSTSTSKTSTSTTPNTAVCFVVNNYVYMTNVDGRAVKGQIESIKKDTQGHAKPMVLWNGQKDPVSVPFSSLKKDNSPVKTLSTFVPVTPLLSHPSTTTTMTKTTSSPVPMDLDSANQSHPPFNCHNCGG